MSAALADRLPALPTRERHLRLVVDNTVPAPVHPADRLRLTARGRLAVRTLAGVVAVALALLVGAGIGLLVRPAPSEVGSVVTVEAGDTLWAVAEAVASPDDDLRDVVSAIVALNGLKGEILVPGQRLTVPAP